MRRVLPRSAVAVLVGVALVALPCGARLDAAPPAKARAAAQAAPKAAAPETPPAETVVPPLPPRVAMPERDPWEAIMAQELPPPAGEDADPTAAEGPALDLPAAVQQGLAANPQILAARNQLLSSDYERKAALGEFGFKTSINYGFNRRNLANRNVGGATFPIQRETYSLNLNVTQPLFTGFRLLSEFQRTKLAKDQARAQLANAELQLALAVQTNFLQLLGARMDVKSAEDAVARLQSQLKVSQAFYEVGLRPKLDVLQSEVELATAEQNLLTARNRVSTQIARLNTLLDLPLESPTRYLGDLVYVPFQLTLEECLERAYRRRPDLDIGRKSVEIAEKGVKIAASEFYPQFSADFNWNTEGDTPQAAGSNFENNDFSEWNVGASMNWNIFEWGATYNTYRARKEDVSRLEAELANLRLEAQNEVKANVLNIRNAQDRIRVARKSLEAAREGFRNALARYQAQVGTSTEVLDAQSRVSESEAQLTQALTDYQTALASLYVSIGEINPSLSPQ